MALSLSSGVIAHSEHDKARFVAPNGKDEGRCDNALRPCSSIAYAVKQASKGDRVLLAAGQYDIASDEELFYLKSTLVPVLGGYNRYDHFQSQSPATNITSLSNVPNEMADELRQRGFKVLIDGKSIAKNKALSKKLDSYNKLSYSKSNVACEGGKADIYDCSNVDLLAHLSLDDMSTKPVEGNDIWGHVDLNNNREYAIMGIRNGAIVVDVTDPTNIKEVGTVTGVDSGWRDVKVYQFFDSSLNVWQAYAYVTSEGSRQGDVDHVTIIDLNSLPNSVSLVENSKVVNTAHNVYISNVDYTLNIPLPNQTASLQLVGANNVGGAFQNYSLSNPRSLSKSNNEYFGSGYTHDGSSININDARAQSDCGLSDGSCTVFLDFNEKEIKLWDISNPENSKQLSQISYNDVPVNNQYVHSGWGTDDQQYILVHDEFDEILGGLNSTVRIFSISDLNNPVQVGQWTGPTAAIDHNGFVRGNRYYMSNYTRGLTILDITDPTSPQEVGFFDTYPSFNNASFNGAWGVYPFLPSGNILVSDINSGLYVLKDNAKESAVGQFSFDSKQINTEQNVELTINVNRNGNTLTSATSVSYQVIPGSAKADDDYTLADGTINWAANDNDVKTVSINIAPEASADELPESFFIRLYNPTNGATLGQNSYATVNVAGRIDTGAGSFSSPEVKIAENAGARLIEVHRTGSSTGELSFTYETIAGTATSGEDFEEAAGQITWADGESDVKTISINVVNDDTEEDAETFTLSLNSIGDSRLGANPTVIITIADDEKNDAPNVTLPENFEANTSAQVSLTALVTDTDDDDMTYLWQQTAGSDVSLSNAESLTASFTAPTAAGQLTFSFTATDYRGAATTQSVTVTVVKPPEVITVTPKSSGGGGSMYLLGLLLLPLTWLRKKKQLSSQ
ncbi:hypothetical protein GCM10017161_03880 [Thalassotalea marina]|uniref:Calx-beta domain-containing protein n=2 Tax=Thalassotalea marina TaxID=1673741 RepID=A0A919BCP9_9GAMM|nr:hypothetical protein GCM10017161_03880 [Thalassotalea marina]